MVLYVFNRYAHHRHLSMRVHSVAVALGFFCLLRPSEYTTATKTNAHVLRASAIEFECSNGPGQQPTLIGAHLMHTVAWSRVLLVRIYMSTAKNFRVGRALWFSAGTTTDSLHIVRVLYDWVCTTRPQPTDFLLSWPTPSVIIPRKALKNNDFTKVIKHAATTFGFAPDLFGPHALRVGGATLLRASGATDGEILLMGRWKSMPACLGYQEVSTNTHDRMLQMLLREGVYTARDIRLQYRIPTLHNATSATVSDSDSDTGL
ncbi:hypothetical protein B484DRAFT_436691 [Ochromonadaceae sp. CCMP2298]|nr:hypothetical protein B484DRAFT_436691 [Ochromonadaceae sp. CCMP2298]